MNIAVCLQQPTPAQQVYFRLNRKSMEVLSKQTNKINASIHTSNTQPSGVDSVH